MKGFRVSGVIFITLFLLLVSCSKQQNVDINEILVKTEEYFSQFDKIDTTASSFDGEQNVKFRLMIEKHPTEEEEAILLFNQIIESFVKHSNHSDVWDYYNGYFDIKSYDSGVIYEANKIIGEDLQIIS